MAAYTYLLSRLAIAILFAIAVSVFPLFQKNRYLCLITLAGAAAFHWQAFPGFVIVAGTAYAAVCWLGQQSDRSHRWRRAYVLLFTLILIFTLGRVLQWDRPVALPGVAALALYSLDMWLALRLVTLFWEVGSGAASTPSLSAYIIWTGLPLTLGGPLLRYSQFSASGAVNRALWKSSAWWLDFGAGVVKLIAGLALGATQQFIYNRWPQAMLGKAVHALFTGPVGFYLETAGYFHIMEALGKPSGFNLPISFNFPLGRENISAFWANWNMTATAVFRDYLFYNRWGRETYNVYLNTMIVFVLVGLWHAANPYWVMWGFCHGLLFCSFLVWRKYRDRFGKLPLRGTPVAQMGARVLTYVSVCACWYIPSKLLQKLTSV